MRIAGERYRLLRAHAWSDEILQQVVEGKGRSRRPQRRGPGGEPPEFR
jgi:hypothetical protein